MNWDRIKNGEKRHHIDLNQGRRKSDSREKINLFSNRDGEKDKDNKIKANKQLSSLNDTLKNMIKTSRESAMPIEVALTGFYKEISKSIKWK